ncbi:MAG TPA: dephospho-CoA kinase [Solibacterales bacterium]|nr:dephospho-CoA kinase [Bryobacterales bacterium]
MVSMLRVGLTGGLATGKSFVGRTLRGLGCHLIQADELGHAVLAPGGEAHDAVLAEFGTVERKQLAAQVFGRPERLARLNELVHPPVIRREEEWLRALEADDPRAIAVVEAAILIETGSYKRFDKLILTVASEAEQVRRAMDRDGATETEVRQRLARQMPLADKRKFADYVIDTNGSKENTVLQVEAVYRDLRSLVS